MDSVEALNFLVSLQDVTGIERLFFVDLNDFDAAVDAVYVHDADGGGIRFDGLYDFFVAREKDDRRRGLAADVGQERFALFEIDAHNFFEDEFHGWGGRLPQDDGDVAAVGPGGCLAFEDFAEVGEGHGARGIRGIDDHGEIRGVGSGGNRQQQQTDDTQQPSSHRDTIFPNRGVGEASEARLQFTLAPWREGGRRKHGGRVGSGTCTKVQEWRNRAGFTGENSREEGIAVWNRGDSFPPNLYGD